MLQRFEKQSRRARVTVQYASAEAAADCARANEASRPESRFFRLRLQLVQELLASCPGGDLLDAGCGPGIMARTLLEFRPHVFRITALDQSPAMVEYCIASTREVGQVGATVGQLEAMPFADASFDVTLVMGALEYADVRAALREISRVTRPGGRVIVTMLNPLSLYRFTEWFVYWPMLRILGAVERAVGIPHERRHIVHATGIRAFPAFILRRLMRQAGLQPIDLVYFDVTPLVPPLDRLPRMVRKAERTAYERKMTRGWWRRFMGTAFLVVAKHL